MSAIWGAISLNGEKIDSDIYEAMKNPYEKCVIDVFGELKKDKLYLGSGLQYVTKEAEFDVLPISDEQNELYFTGDAMLDNREEIAEKLGLKDISKIGDAQLIYELYARDRDKCLNDFLGAYCFIFYDKKNNTVDMVMDSTGNRCLYYRILKGVLYFSSLIQPILNTAGNAGMNEEWIGRFLASDGLAVQLEYEQTIYKDIMKIRPSHRLRFQGDKKDSLKYWNPVATEIKLNDENEYKEKFIETYTTAIKRLLRNDETTLLLSGGLDSTSIACIIAPILKKKGKVLHTITSVPERDFEFKNNDKVLEDESKVVLKTKEFLGNLECEMTEMKDVDPWTYRTKEKEIMEIPYKSMQNYLWLIEGLRISARLNSRILLNGSYGNVTISNSGIGVYMNELLRNKQWFLFIREVCKKAEAFNMTKKQTLKVIYHTIREYNGKEAPAVDEDCLGDSFVNHDLVKKYGIENTIKEYTKVNNTDKMTYEQYRGLMYNEALFSHKGEVATKHSLATGVIPRDPTMDKRLIEFCMRLPKEMFIKNGVSRRMVREFLKDIMPQDVISSNRFGVQSADVRRRVAKKWPQIKSEIKTIMQTDDAGYYLDKDLYANNLEKADSGLSEMGNFDILRILYSAMIVEFINEKSNSNKTVTLVDFNR